MPASPMTPSKHGFDKGPSSPLTLSSGDKKSRFAKQRLTAFIEPSPASTYGETATSSVPATPLEGAVKGTGHQIPTSATHEKSQNFSASPFVVTDSLRRLPIGSSTRSRYSGEDGPPSLYNHDARAEKKPSSTTSSPIGLAKSFRSAPAWRGETENKHLTKGHSDDPFVSSPEVTTLECHGDAVSLGQNPNKAGLTPTNVTAQAIYPPQACVFVANLSQSETDEQLEHAVTEAFEQFGDVYVKIRRDSRQMPFAFAQYTNIEDAQRAINLGRGMLVSGRPCRTEVARVNRSLYLSKINGGPISETEARDIMDGHGNIETLWYASPTEREMFGLPEGVFVRFAFFDDCRDVIATFRESSLYRLEQVKGVEDSRNTQFRGSSNVSSPFKRINFHQPVYQHSGRQNMDRHSIFVGNIPPHLTQDQLASMFQGYGRILHIEMIRKPFVASPSGVNTFAFIEFDHPQSAGAAVQAGSRLFQGLHLRIEHKEPVHTGHRAGSMYKANVRRNLGADSPEFLAAFQRGVTIGMSQAAQSMVPCPFFGQYPYFQGFDNVTTQTEMTNSIHKNAASTQPQNAASNLASAPLSQYGYSLAPSVPYGHLEQLSPYVTTEAPATQVHWPLTSFDNGMVSPSQQL